jgi:hypothetical protein
MILMRLSLANGNTTAVVSLAGTLSGRMKAWKHNFVIANHIALQFATDIDAQ